MIIIDGQEYSFKFEFYWNKFVHEVVTDGKYVTLKFTTFPGKWFSMLSTTKDHSAYKAIMEKKKKEDAQKELKSQEYDLKTLRDI